MPPHFNLGLGACSLGLFALLQGGLAVRDEVPIDEAEEEKPDTGAELAAIKKEAQDKHKEFAEELVTRVESEGCLPDSGEGAAQFLWKFLLPFDRAENNTWSIDQTAGKRIFVIGALHGSLTQLKFVMRRIKNDILKVNSERLLVCKDDVIYIFLGDYVDLGEKDIETAALLLAYREWCPTSVILLRGAHDDMRLGWGFGFSSRLDALKKKSSFSVPLDNFFDTAWQALPVAAAVGKKVLLVHGGLAHWLADVRDYKEAMSTIENKVGLKGGRQGTSESDMHDNTRLIKEAKELRWNYPAAAPIGWTAPFVERISDSTVYAFGSKAMEDFTSKTGIELLVRGHSGRNRLNLNCERKMRYSPTLGKSVLSIVTDGYTWEEENEGKFKCKDGEGFFAMFDGTALAGDGPALEAVTIYKHSVVGEAISNVGQQQGTEFQKDVEDALQRWLKDDAWGQEKATEFSRLEELEQEQKSKQ